ncbi:MAG: geranylgeranyl reductase family protein [Propionibacteriaceae bacterium]|nr:geranylgeranyl reductase family protein [Propionibacteriaceae bacterium]
MGKQVVDDSADVIVVGAGPGGSSTATHLAKAGLSVLLLEKSEFPREKICGDGLTPRAIRELALLGVDVPGLPWKRSKGLRIIVGKTRYLMDWPDLPDFPNFGMAVRRTIFDQFLAEHAVEAGVRLLTSANVHSPIVDRGQITGVVTKDGRRFEAPVVVAADGGSARLAVSMGLHRMESRSMGMAVRTYFSSPLADEDWLDSWLEMWDGPVGRSHLLPGYGWIFPLGDGTCNVGMGLPDASHYRTLDYRDMLTRWLATMPEQWGLTEEHRMGKVSSAALPMGFNRKPVFTRGLLLIGDAAGTVNPFTGEGISYAMESGRFAAEHIVQAHARGIRTPSANRALAAYARHLTSEWGSYFWLGGLFHKFIVHPSIMRLSAHYGLAVPVIRNLTNRLLSHLVDRPSRDGYDRVINALCAIAPEA